LQRLLEFSTAARRMFPRKGLLDLDYDGVSRVLDALKQGKVSTNSRPPRPVSNRTHEYHVVTLKKFFAVNGRKSLAKRLKTPTGGKNREDRPVIPEEDIAKMISQAPTLTERLVVELLNDTGARVSEIADLRLKDVRRDEYSYVLTLRGKTKTRNVRAFTAGPDLTACINQHPRKEDGEAILLLNDRDKEPLGDLGLYRIVVGLSEKTLGKRYHPHMFRRTTATRYAKQLTEYEMKLMFGWKRSESAAPYVQLSMRDIDSKILALHGVKVPKTEMPVTISVTVCPHCKDENPPFAVYCQGCGKPLAVSEEKRRENLERMEKIERELLEMKRGWLELKQTLDKQANGTVHNKRLAPYVSHS